MDGGYPKLLYMPKHLVGSGSRCRHGRIRPGRQPSSQSGDGRRRANQNEWTYDKIRFHSTSRRETTALHRIPATVVWGTFSITAINRRSSIKKSKSQFQASMSFQVTSQPLPNSSPSALETAPSRFRIMAAFGIRKRAL